MRIPAVTWFLALAACTDVIPPRLDDIGDPCRTTTQVCVDDESVQICEDQSWALASCESICASLGPAWIADGCEDGCVCMPANPDACTPGETICVDDDTIGVCDEMQAWEESACAERCATEGLSSAGCRTGDDVWMKPDACWCSIEGTACTNETSSCVGGEVLASCVDGVWVFEDCGEGCSGGYCDPFGQVDVCVCG